jgi:hypothetical protein
VYRGEVQRLGAEGVREMDAQGRSAEREMDDLAQGCVLEIGGGKRVPRLGDLLRGRPCCYPCLRCRLCYGGGEPCQKKEDGER